MNDAAAYRVTDGVLLLRIKVLAGAGRNRIDGVRGGELVVRVKAQARKGEANRELLRFMAKSLGIARTAVEIASGEISAHKVIRLPAEGESRLEPFLHPAD